MAKTNAQLQRLAAKAHRALSYATCMAKCLPEELGTSVAEEFAEGGIELAAQGLKILTDIKCELRIARKRKGTT